MRAVLLRETGGPERLRVEEVPDPEEPALRVRAAAVNLMDVLVRRGEYPQPPELPHVPGAEIAGELDGRRVIALPRGPGGGYAERAVDPDWTFPLPEGATFEEGAAFPMAFLTAWIPLRRLEAETVLVTAASGGVGSAAIRSRATSAHRRAATHGQARLDCLVN